MTPNNNNKSDNTSNDSSNNHHNGNKLYNKNNDIQKSTPIKTVSNQIT